MKLEQRFKNELLPQIEWEHTLQNMGLEPAKKSGYFTVICPKCGKKECAFFPNQEKGDPRFVCNRKNNCQYNEHILSKLNGGSFPNGESWISSVKSLAELSGVQFEIVENPETKFKKNPLLADYWELLKSKLPGSPAETYLKERGLNPNTGDFGYIPQKIEEILSWAQSKGYSEQELVKNGLIIEGPKGNFPFMYGRLSGAFIDQAGTVHNIWGRDLTNKEGSLKYLNLKDSETVHKKSPYGADQFTRGAVYWVEGYLDVAAAKECGHVAVASGTSSVGKEMLESLKGLKTLVIALDGDEAGGNGTFACIEKNANSDLKLYTVNHNLMKGCKDISELYQKHGKEAVDEVFRADNLESAYTFAARYILKKHRSENGWSDMAKENAIEEAIKFDKKVFNEAKIPLMSDFFWKEGIQKELHLDPEAIKAVSETLERKKVDSRLKENLEKGLSKAQEKLQEGDLSGVAEIGKRMSETHQKLSGKVSANTTLFLKDMGDNWLNEEPPKKEMLLDFVNEKGGVQGYLPKGIVGMIAGPGGVGKSHLITTMAMTVCTGKTMFDMYGCKNPGAVFLGMGENTVEDIRRLIWKHTKELSPDQKEAVRSNLAINSFHAKDAAFLNEKGQASNFFYALKEDLIKNAPNGGWRLLIFDPASRLMGTDAEKDNALATRFVSLLEELSLEVPGNPTVIFVHHFSKAGAKDPKEQRQDSARGASGLTDACRWQLNFSSSEKEGQRTYKIAVTKTNFTAIPPEQELEKTESGALISPKKSNSALF